MGVISGMGISVGVSIRWPVGQFLALQSSYPAYKQLPPTAAPQLIFLQLPQCLFSASYFLFPSLSLSLPPSHTHIQFSPWLSPDASFIPSLSLRTTLAFHGTFKTSYTFSSTCTLLQRKGEWVDGWILRIIDS